MTKKIDDKDIRKEVEAGFATMEAQLEQSNPGISELLNAYGVTAESLRQANEYMAVMDPLPVISTSTATGG